LPLLPQATRIGPAVGAVGKVVCVGLNFRDHARESGMALPQQPILFMKATTAICGPDDDVIIPAGSTKTDWEVELGVVVGDVARNVPLERALDYVAGYLVVNDVSEREYQLEQGGQWVKGKSCDTFAPLGPMLVTTDEIADPQNLSMWLEVNGHRYQNGTTADMIFGVAHLVSYISRYMTLMPGDVISTGTPAGVGLGLRPPVYLKVGDVVELGIEGLGRQRQRMVAAKPTQA
jgi:2,4-diketo-3-deoxy-L-fuconate hydrolase